jgi:hypothetical protein
VLPVYVELSADVAVPVGVVLPESVELPVGVVLPVYVELPVAVPVGVVLLPVAEVVMVAFDALVALQEA